MTDDDSYLIIRFLLHNGINEREWLNVKSPSFFSLLFVLIGFFSANTIVLIVFEFSKRDRGGTMRRSRNLAVRASRGPSSRRK